MGRWGELDPAFATVSLEVKLGCGSRELPQLTPSLYSGESMPIPCDPENALTELNSYSQLELKEAGNIGQRVKQARKCKIPSINLDLVLKTISFSTSGKAWLLIRGLAALLHWFRHILYGGIVTSFARCPGALGI